MDQLENYLCARVLFQIDAQRGDGPAASPVLLLARPGFKSSEIADVLGKKPAAVQKAVERARKSKPRNNR